MSDGGSRETCRLIRVPKLFMLFAADMSWEPGQQSARPVNLMPSEAADCRSRLLACLQVAGAVSCRVDDDL